MDGDERSQPDPATYHEYFEPIDEYESIDETSRDSQYKQDDRPTTAPASSDQHEYTALNGLTTATLSTVRDNAALTTREPGIHT